MLTVTSEGYMKVKDAQHFFVPLNTIILLTKQLKKSKRKMEQV